LLFTAESFDDSQVPFKIAQCSHCKLVRTEPALLAEQLDAWYPQKYYGSAEKKFLPLLENFVYLNNFMRAKKIFSHIPKERSPVRILDLGCGRAQLLKIFAGFGCECYGIERQGFVLPTLPDGVRIYTRPLDQIKFEDAYFDAVILWHSLEHLDQPAETLKEACRILKPQGLLVIAAPNFSSLQQRLFRNGWFHLDLPRHRYHFDPRNLAAHLDRMGFHIAWKTTYSFEQNPYGFIQSFMNRISGAKINQFYTLLKSRGSSYQDRFIFVGWSIIFILLLPIAVLENAVSGLAGIGATFTLFGVKE
jgi:SAM-dependent methyltransferase